MIPYIHIPYISLGVVNITTWGLCVALAILLAGRIINARAKLSGWSEEWVLNGLLLSLVGMLIGGRLGYIVMEWFKSGEIYQGYWGAGFSAIGGVMLTVLIGYWYLHRTSRSWRQVGDVIIVGIIPALLVVRIGCFLISDHIGSLTTLPWGMQYVDDSVRHPVALYHIVSLVILCIFLEAAKSWKWQSGNLFLSCLLLMLGARFILDFTRCTDLELCDIRFSSLTVTQWMIIPIIFGVIYLLLQSRKIKR